jgi:hypothetical protein
VTDQVDTAKEVGLETVDFVNKNKTRTEGANVTKVCEGIVDNTEIQQQAAEQLSEDEVLLDIELAVDCDELNDTSSYTFGQTNPARLPGVNVTDSETVEEEYACDDLRSDKWTDFSVDDNPSEFKNTFGEYVRDNVGLDGRIPNDYNETENPDAYNYTEHKKDVLEDISDIDEDNLPDGVTLEDFTDCLVIRLDNYERNYSCPDLRGAVGFDNSTFDTFNQELEQYLYNNVGEPGKIPADYNETENSNYSYTNHTVDVLEQLNSSGDIDLSKLPEAVGGEDSPTRQFARDCFVLEAEEGRAPVDVVFAIDTTGSMDTDVYSGGSDVGTRLELTQKGAKAALDDLNASDKVGLVEYNTNLGNFFCLIVCFYQNGGAEDVVGGMDTLEGGWQSTVESGIDGLDADGNTDITTGLDEAKEVLDSGDRPDTATQHVVLMTDGVHNEDSDEFADPEPTDYINNDGGEYDETFVHTVGLGADADAVEDTLEELANSDGLDSDRPEGTSIIDDDPSKAEDIFSDIIGSIEEERGNVTEGIDTGAGNGSVVAVGSNVSTETNDKEFDVELDTSGGAIEKIYDLGMNVTEFDGKGEYGLILTDTSAGIGTEIWNMTVDNNVSADDDDVETQVRFRADDEIVDEYDSVTIEDTINTSADLTDTPEHVRIQLAPNPNFELVNESGGVEHSSDVDYDMTDIVTNVIQPEINISNPDAVTDGGVAIKTRDAGAGGANGTFSFDFKPINGNFSLVEDAAGDFVDSDYCDDSGGMVTCKADDPDNEEGAYATAQAKEVTFMVTVEGPGGVSEREIEVNMEDALLGGGS